MATLTFVPQPLPEDLLDLLRKPSPCFVATLMPDGSPQLTETWVHTDGEHVVINIVDGHQKARNIARDPRVAVNIADPDDIRRFYAVRGRVSAVTTEGGRESIDEISHKYLGSRTRTSAETRTRQGSSSPSKPTRSPRPWWVINRARCPACRRR